MKRFQCSRWIAAGLLIFITIGMWYTANQQLEMPCSSTDAIAEVRQECEKLNEMQRVSMYYEGVSASKKQEIEQERAISVKTTYISNSWEYGYEDVEELTQSSDLIARVKVKELVDAEDTGPFSTFAVEVTDYILGCRIGDVVKIFMTGGQRGRERIEVIDDPLLEPEQEFLIFAKQNTKRSDTYRILGGPQGRFRYEDNTVSSLHLKNEEDKAAEDAQQMHTINLYRANYEDIKSEILTYL